jgi:hypothetical protein
MENRNPKRDGVEKPDCSGEDSAVANTRALKPTISENPVLGIPVLSFGEDASVWNSEQVNEMLWRVNTKTLGEIRTAHRAIRGKK